MSEPAKGIFLVLSTSQTPGQEDAFQDWYQRTHIPDVLSTGLFLRVSFWRSATPSPEGQPTFVAIYETAREDLPELLQELYAHIPEWHAKGHRNPEMKPLTAVTYLKVSQTEAPASGDA